MKLFSRLGKTPPSPPTVQERIAALSSGSADLVLDAALNAQEEDLRIAAIAKLPDGEALRRLAGLSGGENAGAASLPAVTRAAQIRIAELSDAGGLSQPLDFSQDPKQIARLILEGASSRLRQIAAEQVHDPEQLKSLLQQVRNKDKSVYKILKQTLDARNAEERKAQEIEQDIAERCAALERHSQRAYDSFYKAALEGLKTRWHSLTTPPAADIQLRALQAIERAEQVIESNLKLISQRAAEQAALIAARELEERERQAAQEAAAAQAEAEKEAEARRREEIAAQVALEEAQCIEKRAAEEKTFRQLGGLIRMAHAAIREGATQRAAGLRRSIEEKLPGAGTLPANLLRQIQQLDEKLNELKQWKDFAVAPKRLELIADMEALIGAGEDPKALADRIKALQEEWRTIAKGIVSEAPEEWQRFQKASQAAYEPCRKYFEEQAALRQQNLDKRKALFERLVQFEAAQNNDNPDWRLFETVLREAPREWRGYFPVDREDGRALQAEFDQALKGLQAKLDGWYQRNVEEKQSLIKRARYLLTQQDSREAIDAVKRLQLLWKQSGPAPAAQSQSLWNEFREVCDSVFQKRQQAFAEYASGLEASKAKAIALCEEAERGAALSGAELLAAVAKIPEWRAAYEALDEMPRSDARGLQNRFERAIDSCRAKEGQQRVRAAKQSFIALFEAAKRIHAYQWAVLQAAELPEREALKLAAESFIADVQQWPKGGLKAIKEILAGADSISSGELAARERALKMMCIRGEIRSETPSPPADEALRREYQVQRLMQGMGQGIGADDGGWDAMVIEWIRIGAVAPDLHQSLQARFLESWEKGTGR
jgi:hypothetical protein